VLKHFQARMPYGLIVPDIEDVLTKRLFVRALKDIQMPLDRLLLFIVCGIWLGARALSSLAISQRSSSSSSSAIDLALSFPRIVFSPIAEYLDCPIPTAIAAADGGPPHTL
jgi:hypothetical protein